MFYEKKLRSRGKQTDEQEGVTLLIPGEFRRSIIPDSDDYQDDSRAHLQVNIELNVVRTPVVWFRADLVMLPATGMDPMKDPNMLHMPSAIISWDASTTFAPPAHTQCNQSVLIVIKLTYLSGKM